MKRYFFIAQVLLLAGVLAACAPAAPRSNDSGKPEVTEHYIRFKTQGGAIFYEIYRVNRNTFLVTDMYSSRGLYISRALDYMRSRECQLDSNGSAGGNILLITVANGGSCLPELK